jgi:hypothetical protein
MAQEALLSRLDAIVLGAVVRDHLSSLYGVLVGIAGVREVPIRGSCRGTHAGRGMY